MLVLFDVSSTFDLVDHEILFKRLDSSYGLRGIHPQWLRSCLSVRTRMIDAGNSRTKCVLIVMDVPQGSVLGPFLFSLSTAYITKLIPSHSTAGHLFAEAVQAYVKGSPSALIILADRIQALPNIH